MTYFSNLLLLAIGLLAVICVVTPAAAQSNNFLSWEFRLVGAASPLSGRVEMRPNNTAPWGTICVDMFKESNWGPIAACNSAGFIGVTQAVFSSAYGAGAANSPIYLTNVNCMPTDKFIQNCSKSQLQQVGNCVHWEDVGVDCSPPTNMWQFGLINGTAPSNGILAIKPMPSLAWGSVYYYYFVLSDYLKHLELVCADVGYNLSFTKDQQAITRPSRYVFNRIKYTPTVNTFFPYYYSTNCPTNAKNIRECNYYQMGSQSWDPWYYSIYVDCRPPQSKKIPGVQVRLTNPWIGWRSGVGNIEIRGDAVSPWTNVCAELIAPYAYQTPSWSTPTAAHTANMKAICTAAGYLGATNPQFRRYGSSSAAFYNSTFGYYEYFADRMNCIGATSLADCEILEPSGSYYCGWTVYYAGVDCYALPENRTEWEFRLWPALRGNGITNGVFQMRPNRTAPWASIQTQSTATVWDVICRTLGNNITSSGYAQGRPFGIRKDSCFYGCSGNMSYWLETVSCSTGDGVLLKDCSLSPLGSYSVGYSGQDLALDCNPPPFDPSKWQFRLVGANASQGTGMLEFKPQPYLDWGYIIEPYGIPIPSSSYTWYGFNAFAICHSLGYMNVEAPTIQIYRQFLNNSAPIYYQYMRCTTNDVYVQNCSFQYRLFDTYQQSNYWAMGVECYPYIFRPMWRLAAGGVPWMGRLEYKYEENGQWGTVCNDYFKNNYIAWNAACHSAGWLNVTGARYRSFGPGTGNIVWDDIVCNPGNFYIENCTKRPLNQHNCFHGQDAGVDCYPPPDRIDLWEFRLNGGTAATNGRLEMRPSNTATWGTVCSDPFNHSHHAWLAACRTVGFPNVQRAAWRYFGKGAEPIYLDNVQCFPNSTTLTNCTTDPIDSFFCTAWDAAGVDCDPPPETPGSWQFRLVGCKTASSGRLEMRPTTTSAWGNVCRRGLFNSRIALLAVCKTMGYNAVRPVPRFFGKGTGVIYLDNATCAPGTSILNQCTFNPLYSHQCTHDMDFGIECFPTSTVAMTLTKTETRTKALKATKSIPLSSTVTQSLSPLLTVTKPLKPKYRTATRTPISETRSLFETSTISKTIALPRTQTHLIPPTLSFIPTKSIALPNSQSDSRSKHLTPSVELETTLTNVRERSRSMEATISLQNERDDRTLTKNQTYSKRPETSKSNVLTSSSTLEVSEVPEATASGHVSESAQQPHTPTHRVTATQNNAHTLSDAKTLSINRTDAISISKTIIPVASCELNATSTIGQHVFFAPMGSGYTQWPMSTEIGVPLESQTFDITLPNNFPLNAIGRWTPAMLWIYDSDGKLSPIAPTGVSLAVTIQNGTESPKLSISLSAPTERQTFTNLFPSTYTDRSALVVMNLSTATSCQMFNIRYLVVARLVFTEQGFIGGAPQPDGEPHVEESKLVVPEPTFLAAPPEAGAIARSVLPCDVRVLPASMAYYRMLSPFAIAADFFAVLLGTGVFLLFVLGSQVVTVLAARTFRVRRTLFGCAAVCRAPAITIAVTQPLGLGVAYASASLIAQSEAKPENWVFGLAGCLIVAVLPFPILLFLYRCVSRRYVAYVGVAPDPFPAWLAPHIFPYGRQKPELFAQTLAPLINFRNVSPLWPLWSFLSPIGTMVVILALAPVAAMCEHVFLALAVLHLLLACVFAAYRPRRSTVLSFWTVLQLLVTAVMFLSSALTVYNPESSTMADFSYVMCIVQTAFVGVRIALTPVCFWSDRVFSYQKVKAVAEHIAPEGERFELNPGDADYQRDDEDVRMANLDDDRLSDMNEEPLLLEVGRDEAEEQWTNLLASPATKEVPDFDVGPRTNSGSDSTNLQGEDSWVEEEAEPESDEQSSQEDSSDLSSEVEL